MTKLQIQQNTTQKTYEIIQIQVLQKLMKTAQKYNIASEITKL